MNWEFDGLREGRSRNQQATRKAHHAANALFVLWTAALAAGVALLAFLLWPNSSDNPQGDQGNSREVSAVLRR